MKAEKSSALVPFVYSNYTAVMLVNRISLEEGLFKVLVHPRITMQKEDYSIYLTTLIIPAPSLELFSWKLSVDQHVASLVSHTAMLFTIVRAKISPKLCGELLNSYPDFSRVSKNQKSKSLFT